MNHHSQQKKNVYVVLAQGEQCEVNYEELYHDSHIVYVYCHNVFVTIPAFEQGKECQLFSFEPLPDTITCKDTYERHVKELSEMMHEVLEDKNNKVLIWTFPLKTEHIGTYLRFIHSLERRGKTLVFHISALDMEALLNDSLFSSLNKTFLKQGVIQFNHSLEVAS